MPTTEPPNVWLLADQDGPLPTLRQADFTVKRIPWTSASTFPGTEGHLLIMLPPEKGWQQACEVCQRLSATRSAEHVPILVLANDHHVELLHAGAAGCLPIDVPKELLLAQVHSLLRERAIRAHLVSRATEARDLNQRLQSIYRQIELDQFLIQRLTREALPRELIGLEQARLAVLHRPRSRMGGDFYGVARLDEEHISVYLADAMGRGGIVSGLLTLFVRQHLHQKDIIGHSYRLVTPEEVLAEVNRELLLLGQDEPPLVSLVYLQINCRDGHVVYSRAATPPPLHINSQGSTTYWNANGPFLGVSEAKFQPGKGQLLPGDKLLLYSDGVRSWTGANDPDLLAEAARRYYQLPAQQFVDNVGRDVLVQQAGNDDFTLLVVEFQE